MPNNFETTLEYLQQSRDRIDQAITTLQTALGVKTVGNRTTKAVAGTRKLSQAAKAKIALAQKARWAERKKAKLQVVGRKKAA